MTRARLFELADLILECAHWGHSHSANIEIDNAGDHRIYVYPNVGKDGSKSTVYFCNPAFIFEDGKNGFVYDKNFDAAEARIRQLLEEIKMDEVEEVG